MAPRSVLDTCDWTATSAKLFGRYLRARARDIARREYPRPDGATLDTACRCYLRGPDGVSGLTPSGTWGTSNIISRVRGRERTRNCKLKTTCLGQWAERLGAAGFVRPKTMPRVGWSGLSVQYGRLQEASCLAKGARACAECGSCDKENTRLTIRLAAE